MKQKDLTNKIIHIDNMGWCIVEEHKTEGVIFTPLDTEKAYTAIKKTTNSRTIKQNASMHMYFSKVAKALNDGGFTVNSFLNRKQEELIKEVFNWGKETASKKLEKWFIPKKITDWVASYLLRKLEERILDRRDLELEWTSQLVKDIIWRNIQLAIFKDKPSTTQLSSEEVTKVYHRVDSYLSSIGIESISFPSEQSMIFEQNYRDI